MSFRKKIIFSFIISAFIIAVLAAFEYYTYVQVKSEMRFLEVTDTLRSKSLQLRRHEKNFFLYPDKAAEESAAIYDYIGQLEEIAERSITPASVPLGRLIEEYRERFGAIEAHLSGLSAELLKLQAGLIIDKRLARLLEADFRDRPLYVSGFLMEEYSMPSDHPLVTGLKELDYDVDMLRKAGEALISASKVLDKSAREKAERGIHISQTAILVVFPVFLAIGLGALLYISGDMARRLKTLTDSVEKVGEKYGHSTLAEPSEERREDEVGRLIKKFNRMHVQLTQWEEELREKNMELLQSKKLAAIGTLAAGVAHELNNPLNNIGISAQVLQRLMRGDTPAEIREILDDITSQTTRVRGIVADLLEFAREREPQLRDIELLGLVEHAYGLVRKSMDTSGVRFSLEAEGEKVPLRADPDQLERVFVNLFTNAVAAMDGKGELIVKVAREDGQLRIWVSDNGRGMPEADREKVFDPFFTRKEKGTGLGLAITLGIIRKHGGGISVTSEEGEGTAFEITLPTGERP